MVTASAAIATRMQYGVMLSTALAALLGANATKQKRIFVTPNDSETDTLQQQSRSPCQSDSWEDWDIDAKETVCHSARPASAWIVQRVVVDGRWQSLYVGPSAARISRV